MVIRGYRGDFICASSLNLRKYFDLEVVEVIAMVRIIKFSRILILLNVILNANLFLTILKLNEMKEDF